MKQFTRYDKLTGKIICYGTCSEKQLANQSTEYAGLIDGHYDAETYYINSDGTPVKKEQKPSDDHDFDYTKKTWTINQERKNEKAAVQLAADEKQAKIDRHEAEHEFIRQLMKDIGEKK